MFPLLQTVRALLRAPGFSAAATLTFTLGIGLSVAVFTVADALLIRELPVVEQDRLVVMWGETRDGRFSNYPLPLGDVRELARRSRSLRGVAFFAFRGATPATVREGDRVLRVRNALVSGNFFDVLAVRPALGRALRPEDDRAGAPPVAVISHRAWLARFGGDSAVVGRSLELLESDGRLTIVGVMPAGLEYPRGAELWTPLIARGTARGFLDLVSGELDILARLAPGATRAAAREELSRFFARESAPASQRDARGVVHTFRDATLGDTGSALLLIALASALLLLVSCVNVANLLLLRALGRVREFAVRSALGGSRVRLAARLFTESALLSATGGVLGIGLAFAAVSAFSVVAPAGTPRLEEIEVNGAALLAAFVVAASAMLASGIAPVLFTFRIGAADVLRSGSRHGGGRRVRAASEALVVAQIALAVVCLTAAGLVTRSLVALERVELAFEPERLLVAELALGPGQFSGTGARLALLDELLPRVRALPGVRAATPVLAAPFVGAAGGVDGRLSLPGQSPEESARGPMLNMEVVAPDYFATLGTPVLRGRSFAEGDRRGATPVGIVSSSAARHFWPDDDPIGKRLTGIGTGVTVVGVVPDTRYRDLLAARPSVYFPLRQSPFPIAPTTLVIRTSGSPGAVVSSLRAVVSELGAGVGLASATPVASLLDGPRAQPRLSAMVLALFAGASVSLAAIGLFSTIAMTVRRRTREIGIRMALGATAAGVRAMVLKRALAITGIGLAAGMAGALATGRLMSGLLFEIGPADIVTLAFVALTMLCVAAIASVIPVRSRTALDPMIALRDDA